MMLKNLILCIISVSIQIIVLIILFICNRIWKSSAILSVKELIEFAEQGNKGEETISVPGLYTENKIYINTAAVFGIKGLLLTQKGHAGVSNLNLGELKKVLKKLEDRK